MNQQKMTAPVLEHRYGHKNAGSKSTKTRTTILLAAAKVCNWLLGVFGLCVVMAFGIPPLIGIGEWQARPLAAGALLSIIAACVEACDA